jgi:hypothetical protein
LTLPFLLIFSTSKPQLNDPFLTSCKRQNITSIDDYRLQMETVIKKK